MKHTQGPWKVEWYPREMTAEIETVAQESGEYRHITNAMPMSAGRGDERESITCDGYTGKYYSAESCANARLIAAAPDMLEALELALATIKRLKPPKSYDSTQGTRDVMMAAIAKAKGEL